MPFISGTPHWHAAKNVRIGKGMTSVVPNNGVEMRVALQRLRFAFCRLQGLSAAC